MERVSVLCLLFLCSLSGADLMTSGNSEQREPRPESVNVPERTQAGPSNVHAALLDLTTKLAVLQTKMEQLQTLNQEQAVKLRELQLQASEVEALKQKQQAQAMEVDKLNKRQQEQATKLREVDLMKEQLQGQAVEINSLKTRTNVTENHVDSLRRDREVGRVAFSASLVTSGGTTLGPFNAATTMIFRHVFSNIGNAYNPNTGLFIAPVRGVYHFEVYIHGYPDNSHPSAATLVKNGQNIVSTYAKQSSGAVTPAIGATLLLEPSDVVFVRQWDNSKIYDNSAHHTSFSGHLLFPM